MAACQFQHGSGTERPDGRLPYPTGDAPATDDAGQSQPTATCHSTLPDIRLCLDFEPPALSNDFAGHTVDVSNVTQMARGGQSAAQVTYASNIYVHDRSADLDVSPLSMEMWIAPHAMPSSTNQTWLISSSGEYGLGLTPSGVICGVASFDTDVTTATSVALQLDAWTHVACVYDGNMLKLYVAGDLVSCSAQQLAIDTSVQGGIDVGTAYTGGLDDVHVYGSALADSDICGLATGGTACKSACAP